MLFLCGENQVINAHRGLFCAPVHGQLPLKANTHYQYICPSVPAVRVGAFSTPVPMGRKDGLYVQVVHTGL